METLRSEQPPFVLQRMREYDLIAGWYGTAAIWLGMMFHLTAVDQAPAFECVSRALKAGANPPVVPLARRATAVRLLTDTAPNAGRDCINGRKERCAPRAHRGRLELPHE
jgi:hypothetical protein